MPAVTGSTQNVDPYAALSPRPDAKSNQMEEMQDRFLTLLVTQMKNQDPMNPLDNAQVTQQMAQISTVTGVEKLNATLQKIVDTFNGNQMLEAAAMVGHGVLVPGGNLKLGNGIAVGGVEVSGPADKVLVKIQDGSGRTVRTLDLGAQDVGSLAFQWDGKDDSGTTLANGAYSMLVEATRGSDKVDVSALEAGLVSAVVRSANGVRLDLGGLATVSMDQVKQIL